MQDCKCVSGISEKELVRMIASVESDSTHPIAKAIVNYAKLQDIGLRLSPILKNLQVSVWRQ